MFAVVVDEHFVGEDVGVVGVDVGRGADGHLEAPHVPGVARVLQAVLVTLQKELQTVPGIIIILARITKKKEKIGKMKNKTWDKIKKEK